VKKGLLFITHGSDTLHCCWYQVEFPKKLEAFHDLGFLFLISNHTIRVTQPQRSLLKGQ
jgi:hypothetical protein